MNGKKAGGLVSVGLGLGILAFATAIGRKNMKATDITPVDMPDARTRIVNAARGELGKQDPRKYWDVVLPDAPGFHGEWCGGFALWAIKEAGYAPNMNWVIGKGFCYQLPITHDPKPGDVAYFDKPYQHHAIVERVEGSTLYTIDGNQAGDTVKERSRPVSSATAFYSVEPLLKGSINV